MFEKFKKSKKIPRKSKIKRKNITKPSTSATIVQMSPKPSEYTIFKSHLIPPGVDVKSLDEVQLKAYPLINDPSHMNNVVIHQSGTPSQATFTTLWNYVKGSPEILSIFSAITEDILSDGYYLEGGKNKKIKAEKYLEKNRFKEVITSMLWDALATGNGYIWKAGIGNREIKSIVDKIPFNTNINREMLVKSIVESDNLEEKKMFVDVPSSTMLINYDKNGIVKSYIQRVGSNTINFKIGEISHFRLMKIDGKVYGYTPLSALTSSLDTLSYIKDYASYFFESGGIPNWIFVFENETPNSPTMETVKQTIQQYASLQNKWKSMLLTGKVTVNEINKLNKDMEFRELARYITQVIVMTWGIPGNRLSDMLIEKGVRGATASSEGYYRKISHIQDLIEDLVNIDLLADFEVRLKFNRTYKQDEEREVQIKKIQTDIVEQRLRLGLIDYETAANELKLDDKLKDKMKELWKKMEDYAKEHPEILMPTSSSRIGGSQQYNQGQLNKHQQMEESPDKRAQDMDKQDSAIRSDNTKKKK